MRFENRSNAAYSGWVYATLPIPRGVAPDAATLALVTLSDPITGAALPTVATPLKWHWTAGARSSIALASVRTRVDLAPQQRIEYPAIWGTGLSGPFVWNQPLASWISSGTLAQDVHLLARFQGDPNEWIGLPPGPVRTLDRNAAALIARGRTHFVRRDDPSIVHPLSLTTYWSLQSDQAHGSVTFVVGNDTLERPVAGGIQIADLYLSHRLPFLALPKARPTQPVDGPVIAGDTASWGLLHNQTLADGQEYAVDFAFAVTTDPNDPAFASMRAAADSPLIGIADFRTWSNSRAAGPIGYLPAPRFATLADGRAALEPAATLPTSLPTDDLGIVNRNPPQTGDQPDFMAGIPVFYLQALQTGSSAPLMKALVAAKRESWRPSHYWDGTGSAADRASLVRYPELFFWSGRPHYDPSWNLQYPQWNTRAGAFVPGNTSGWAGMDNQHFGHNAVRAAYELTADPFLGDLLRANLSIAYWDFFTDWMPATEAERTGRCLKEAVLLYSLFPDAPEAPALRTAIERKLQVFANTALQFDQRYSFAAIAAVHDDVRVPLSQQFPGQDVHMSWQAGFHLEAMVQARRILANPYAEAILRHYLDHAHQLFVADGTPKTYTLMSDPTQFSTGGIGHAWWTGWVLADQVFPSNQNHALLQDRLRPLVRTALTPTVPGTLWWANDRWRCFE